MKTIIESARIKLTLIYLLIFLCITSVISTTVYYRTVFVVKSEYSQIDQSLRGNATRFAPQNQKLLSELLDQHLGAVKKQIFGQLMMINGIIGLIFVFAGYYFSGLTLKPIEDSHEAQRRFIADAAHELKTPIAAMKTALEVHLLDKTQIAKNRKLLEQNLNQVNSLQAMTESLLKLARVNEQKLLFTPTKVQSLLMQVRDYLEITATKKHILLVFPYVNSLVTVKGDKGALLDLLLILFDNALKYSGENSVIKCRVTSRGSRVTIKVIDQGIGIENKDQEKIFERFFRADSSRTVSSANGYGLGLSVAKKIVDEHDGSITVKSVMGAGSTFSVVLPKG